MVLLLQYMQLVLLVGAVVATTSSTTPAITSTTISSATSMATANTTSQSASLSTNASPSTSMSMSTTLSSVPVATPPALQPGQLPNSFPLNPNITLPGNFDESWQDVYLVTQGLPNITFALPRNFAGNIPVNRTGHANNTYFFWAMEHSAGSLTATASQLPTAPWMIWLGGGGGPGSTATLPSMVYNGPMLLNTKDFTITQNPKSLSNILDVIWVDQPVGVGYSTVDSDGYAKDENDVVNDFTGFLSNLVQIFPSLSRRPFILAGEDYVGVYISHIAEALATSPMPPAQLSTVVIGNGILGNLSQYPDMAATSIIQSMPQLINYDETVYSDFASKSHLCGFDLNLTYPQSTALPSLPSSPRRSSFWSTFHNESQVPGLMYRRSEPLRKRQSPSIGPQLDPWYGCALFDEMIDYAANFSSIWATGGAMDVFDLSDALSSKTTFDAGVYFNDLQVRQALNAPFSKNWSTEALYPFGSTLNISSTSNVFGDPTPSPSSLLDPLLASLSPKNISLVLYSGTLNAIAPHHALTTLIQNATFGGVRGFTRQPSTPLVADSGARAGIVHTERGVTFALFDGLAAPWRDDAGAAYGFFRDFVVARGAAGSLTVDGGGRETVIGGEDASVRENVPRVASAVVAGSAAETRVVSAPSASLAAWADFIDAQLPPANQSSDAMAQAWTWHSWISTLAIVLFWAVLV